MKTIYTCSVKKFNGRVSEYLSEAFGEPFAEYLNGGLGSLDNLCYGDTEDKKKIHVDVKILRDWEKENAKGKAVLITRVKLTLQTPFLPKEDDENPIKKNLDMLLR